MPRGGCSDSAVTPHQGRSCSHHVPHLRDATGCSTRHGVSRGFLLLSKGQCCRQAVSESQDSCWLPGGQHIAKTMPGSGTRVLLAAQLSGCHLCSQCLRLQITKEIFATWCLRCVPTQRPVARWPVMCAVHPLPASCLLCACYQGYMLARPAWPGLWELIPCILTTEKRRTGTLRDVNIFAILL